MEILYFETAAAFRRWLAEQHAQANELWVGLYKKSSGKPSLTYPEALDEALCFGWIDGVRKTVDAERYCQRFTPRRPSSRWSLVNLQRARELCEQGRMQPAGLKAYHERDLAKSEETPGAERDRPLDPAYAAELQADPTAWQFFQAQPAGFRRLAVRWIMSAKQEITQRKRLAGLIAAARAGRRPPEMG